MTAATPASATSPTQAKNPTTTRDARLTVNRAALQDNWRFFASVAPGAETAAVVKADAYGLGAGACATALAQAGARTFFVATGAEGHALRADLGPGPVVFVLNGPQADADLQSWAGAALVPVLNSPDQAQAWRGAGWPGPAAVHLDTGMNRLGAAAHEIEAMRLAFADQTPALVMSHLACASSPGHPANAMQQARFLDVASAFPNAPRSLSASAGALLGPTFAFDLIRPGIGLYGGGALDADNPPLRCVARLTAPIIQVRAVEAGETVGYGATWTAPDRRVIATVAIGYADGVLRARSGRGYASLDGFVCPLLGRVSMDLATLDVTGVPGAHVGARVEFLGPETPLDAVASWCGTLPYEVLTSLAGRPRIYG